MGSPLEERFWSKVQKGQPDECWPWTKAVFRDSGYGQFRFEGRPQTASRVAMILNGTVFGPGEEACHTCDNRLCCNPAHLFAGTRADNMADAKAKGRMSSGPEHGRTVIHRVRGEDNVSSKLYAVDIPIIRRMLREGISQRSIGARFNVSHKTINKIALGRTWAHIPAGSD